MVNNYEDSGIIKYLKRQVNDLQKEAEEKVIKMNFCNSSVINLKKRIAQNLADLKTLQMFYEEGDDIEDLELEIKKLELGYYSTKSNAIATKSDVDELIQKIVKLNIDIDWLQR